MRKIRIYLRQYGQIKTFDADHLPIIPGVFDAPILENCSTACLEAVHQRVAATRAAEGKSRDEQRADLRATATKARGYEIFREGDTTSLESDNLPEGPTSAAPDRTAPVAESVKPLFVDPRTGTYFTRTALREIARTDIQRFRILMRNGNCFLNELLAQAN